MAFAALGFALTFVDREWPTGHWPAQYAALVAGVIGLVSFAGHLVNLEQFYRVTAYINIAPVASALLLVLGGGVLGVRRRRGLMAVITSDRSGGLLARRLLPAALLLPVAKAWVQAQAIAAGFRGAEFVMVSVAGIGLAVSVWLIARRINRDPERAEQAAAELRETHEELALSAERLRLAVTGADLATWHWDLTTNVMVWSDARRQILGLPTDAPASHETLVALLHPADRDAVEAAVSRARTEGGALDIEGWSGTRSGIHGGSPGSASTSRRGRRRKSRCAGGKKWRPLARWQAASLTTSTTS
jgi:PAS domain-containing protein